MSGSLAPDVYFPIEITSREYAGSILLAVELARRGMTAVVGHKRRVLKVMAHAERPGVLFFKGGHDGDWRNTSGHTQVGLDPEAGITDPSFAHFFARRKALSDLSTTAAQFCYGAEDHDFLTATFPDLAHRFHRVGTPRVQAWGPEGEALYGDTVDAIARRYGRFVLVVSSRGELHPSYVDGASAKGAAWRTRNAGDVGATERSADLARRVASDVGVAVVVRPHPAESWEAWRRVVRRSDGVHLEAAFDLSAWARAAAVIVHVGRSTAAFESVCAGTPAVALTPQSDLGWASARLSHQAHDLEHAMELIGMAVAQRLAVLPSAEAALVLERRIDRPATRPTSAIAEVLAGMVDVQAPSALDAGIVRQMGKVPRLARARDEAFGRTPPFKRWPLAAVRVQRDVDAIASMWGSVGEVRSRGLGQDCVAVLPAGAGHL